MFAIYITDREFLQKVKDKTSNPTSKQAGDINRYFTKEKINEEYELGKRKLSHTNVPLDRGTEMPHAPQHDPKKEKMYHLTNSRLAKFS